LETLKAAVDVGGLVLDSLQAATPVGQRLSLARSNGGAERDLAGRRVADRLDGGRGEFFRAATKLLRKPLRRRAQSG
jgi:hypothetical protein